MSLRGSERRTFGGLLIEVVLISVGVFAALLANNWHEDREHRSQAKAALNNFLGEMQSNLQAIQKERPYHETLAKQLAQFLGSNQSPTDERFNKEVHFEGVHPVLLERTAWDLAIATQALSYLEPELAFSVSKVYTQQSAFQTLQNSFLASAYTPTSMSSDSMKGLATAMLLYLGDVNTQEPKITSSYEKVIPDIQGALNSETKR